MKQYTETRMQGAYKRRVSTAHVPTLLDASPRVLALDFACFSSPLAVSISPSRLSCSSGLELHSTMPTKEELLTLAQSASEPRKKEALYREILGTLG